MTSFFSKRLSILVFLLEATSNFCPQLRLKQTLELHEKQTQLLNLRSQTFIKEKELLELSFDAKLKDLERRKKAEMEICRLENLLKFDSSKRKEIKADILRWEKRIEAANRTLDVEPPQWDVPVSSWPRHIVSDVTHYFLDPSNHQLTKDPTVTPAMVGMRLHPFAKGNFRFAYYARRQEKRLVLKELIASSENSAEDLAVIEEDLHLHLLAGHFTKSFNKRKPREAFRIHFGEVGLYKVNLSGKRTLMFGEDLLEGKFTKYNSNSGFVRGLSEPADGGDNGKCLQAFSHFTYERSGKKLVICDLQGCWDPVRQECRLTDPACHTLDEKRRFGESNCGPKGIDNFFSAHHCNEICHKMELPRHPKQK